jgi:hypothetical protein
MWEARNVAARVRNLVFVSVSDGIGVGVVVNGELLRGRHNIAGEFAHMPLSIDGPRCSCGAIGCWEAHISNLATLTRYFGRPQERTSGDHAFTIDSLIARARSGDVKAAAAIQAPRGTSDWGWAASSTSSTPTASSSAAKSPPAWDLIESSVRSRSRRACPFAGRRFHRHRHCFSRRASAPARRCHARRGADICRAGRGLIKGAVMRMSAAAVAAMIAAMLIATPARAQVPTGTILGTVKDAQGAVVPGASVTATNLGTQFSRNAVTDAAGEYALRLLPVGNYQVEVSIPGFKNFTQTGIVLEVGRNARVDATIELGAVSETVSVVGDSPLVDTTSAALTRTVGQNEVLNLPLVNRDLYQLLSITGGVTSNTSSNSLGGPEQVTMINGSGAAQMGTVNFQLDGGNNTAGLRGTGNPGAEPRSGAGVPRADQRLLGRVRPLLAGVVDIVTKSGTNVFHGAAFDFIRNEKLNSPRWAPPGTVGTNDPLDRKQFGGAFGGPLAKDKTFFFSELFGDCVRKRRITGTPPWCRRRSSAPATSRSRRSNREIP